MGVTAAFELLSSVSVSRQRKNMTVYHIMDQHVSTTRTTYNLEQKQRRAKPPECPARKFWVRPKRPGPEHLSAQHIPHNIRRSPTDIEIENFAVVT